MNIALYSKCVDCGTKIKYRTTRCDECQSKKLKHTRDRDKDDEVRSIYQTTKWRKVREQVKIRDMGLCQLYLLEDKIVPGDAVHHIESLRLDTLHLAFDMSNLVLLSKEKHDEIHRLGINTKEKFIKYINKYPRLP